LFGEVTDTHDEKIRKRIVSARIEVCGKTVGATGGVVATVKRHLYWRAARKRHEALNSEGFGLAQNH